MSKYIVIQRFADGKIGEVRSADNVLDAGVLQMAMIAGTSDYSAVEQMLNLKQPDWADTLSQNLNEHGRDRIKNSKGESAYVFALWD